MGKFRCFSATFFMIGALVMTMVSCDTAEGTDDGDEEKSEEARLVGTWEMLKNESYFNGELVHQNVDCEEWYEFKSDGTAVLSYRDGSLIEREPQTYHYYPESGKLMVVGESGLNVYYAYSSVEIYGNDLNFAYSLKDIPVNNASIEHKLYGYYRGCGIFGYFWDRDYGPGYEDCYRGADGKYYLCDKIADTYYWDTIVYYFKRIR